VELTLTTTCAESNIKNTAGSDYLKFTQEARVLWALDPENGAFQPLRIRPGQDL
jgi:hypothetical protein